MQTPRADRPPVVGFVGAGQLARMAHQAAIPLGIRLRLLAEKPDDAAALIAPEVVIGSPRSASDLATFAAGCDVVTFDHELVDADALRALEAAGVAVRPSAGTVSLAQDKIRQRAAFAALGFPVPAHRPVAGLDDLLRFGDAHGWPVVAKAGRGGYDGRGVWVLADPAAARAVVPDLVAGGVALLAEAWVPIEREVAALVARRPNGETAVYPVVETVQRDGICHELLLPAPIPDALAAGAQALAVAVAEAVGAVGIMALELFVSGGRLLVNEIAARPHNSGHVTIEGCVTSQFEQHLRAVLDWPLGPTGRAAPCAATVNVVGTGAAEPRTRQSLALAAVPDAHVHLYGKEPRPGRKVGHVTVLGDDLDAVRAKAGLAADLLSGAPPVGGSTS